MVVADYDAGAGRARRRPARRATPGSPRRRIDASTRRRRRRALPGARHHPRPQRRRSALRHADLRGRVRGRRRLPRHGDVAVAPAPGTRRTSETGVKLGDEQFARAAAWADAGRLALVGIGVEPGLSDVFARYAADHLFSEIDEIGVRDGANLVVEGYDFAPSFSIWTTIEECLNPPVIWERDRGWYTTPPFSEPETFDFPEGIGPVECVNVEHEEVLLDPALGRGEARDLQVRPRRRVHRGALRSLHKLGLDRTDKLRVGGVEVSPRDVVAAALPDPAALGDRMRGKTCAGTWVTGTGKDGQPRAVYLYHVVDNEWTMREYGSQAVVWQTAINPVVALELLATGRVVRRRACSGRRRSMPSRSSTC